MGLASYFHLSASFLLAGMVFPPALPARTPAPSPPSGLPRAAAPASPATPVSAVPAPVTAPQPGARAAPPPLSPELLGDIDRAHQRFKAAIADYSTAPQMTARLWEKTGVAYEMLRDSSDALRCYRKALALNPNYAAAWNNLGTLYGLQQNYKEADRMYRRALELDPNSAQFLRNFGTNLMAEHKFAQGWDAYQGALAIDPNVFTEVDGPIIGNTASVHERGAMYYYIALGCVSAGDSACAVKNLRAAIARGFASPKKVAADHRFQSLRRNRAFQQLLQEESSR